VKNDTGNRRYGEPEIRGTGDTENRRYGETEIRGTGDTGNRRNGEKDKKSRKRMRRGNGTKDNRK
jgi:hypothetical protein